MEQSFAPDLFTDWFGCAKDKIKPKNKVKQKNRKWRKIIMMFLAGMFLGVVLIGPIASTVLCIIDPLDVI